MIFLFLFSSNVSAEEMLYTEAELTASMPRIETINFHQVNIFVFFSKRTNFYLFIDFCLIGN